MVKQCEETDRSTGGNGSGAYTSSRKAIDVTSEVSGSDIRDWVVVWRNTDINVLALISTVHPDVLHRDLSRIHVR